MRIALRVVFVAVLLCPAVYFFQHLSDTDFLHGAMGELFATTIGILVGVPVAMYIGSSERALVRRSQEDDRESAVQVRLRDLVGRLTTEMDEDIGHLEALEALLGRHLDRPDTRNADCAQIILDALPGQARVLSQAPSLLGAVPTQIRKELDDADRYLRELQLKGNLAVGRGLLSTLQPETCVRDDTYLEFKAVLDASLRELPAIRDRVRKWERTGSLDEFYYYIGRRDFETGEVRE